MRSTVPSEIVVEVECRGELGVVFKESPFAKCVSGAPGGDYLSCAILDCRGAPTADTAFMVLPPPADGLRSIAR